MKIEIFEYGKYPDRTIQWFTHIKSTKQRVIFPEDRSIHTYYEESNILKEIQKYINKNNFTLFNIQETYFDEKLIIRFYLTKE